MNLIICGSRSIKDFHHVAEAINQLSQQVRNKYSGNPYIITQIISGGAVGVDTNAEKYAEQKEIKFKLFKPDWKRYGKGAGVVRNKEMINYSVGQYSKTIVLSIWDNKSKGTVHTINYALKRGIDVYMFTVDQNAFWNGKLKKVEELINGKKTT
jgi:predicted Rossmann fold nucleotide-binding protein DprA/Smf involved in DNA uptake